MKRKLLALVIALVMVLPLLPLSGVFSFAEEGIMYYDENGNVQYYVGPLNRVTPSNWGEDGTTTWYYVNETFNPYNRLSFRGDVHLILGNNALITFDDLNEPHPFETASYNGRRLTIYAQSKDKNACGKLILNCLGSEGYRGLGNITINGGNIVTTAIENYTYLERGIEYMCDSAGLGMYNTYEYEPRYAGGSITINGGFIKATGSNFAAGIGGSFGSSVKTITINGGEIEARGGYGAPGIGTGYNCGTKNEECEININGGTITAIGGDGAPGIGSGFKAMNDLTINITGGVINATAGTDNSNVSLTDKQKEKYKITELNGGAGIGCGAYTHGDVTVNVSGGNVTANAGQGAGIGGSNVNVGNVNVNITGGTVNATSSMGAGIGTGYYQNWKNQNNGKVTNVNISGGTVTASSTDGAGIGAGSTARCPVNVNISDGNVHATCSYSGAEGIGNGRNPAAMANVTLSWSRVDSSIYANSYNDGTVLASNFRDVSNVNPRKIASISEAEGTTIRPFVYDYEFGSEEGLYLEMTGCEKKYLDEYLANSFIPYLEEHVIYVVDKDITVQTLVITGTTVLFLKENTTLTVTDGVYVINDEALDIGYGDGNLIIVAEKEDSGKLVVGPALNGAAIGSYVDANMNNGVPYKTGLIRVYSGTVEAYGSAGYPAIGGKNLTFSMYGGAVKAYGGQGAPGIGAFPGDTDAVTIDIDGGRLLARGGTSANPVGLGGTNATISFGWNQATDAFDLDPCAGNVTIDSGKEFKYLNSSPVQAAVASDFVTGGVFVPHASTYYIDGNGVRHQVDDFIELDNNGSAMTAVNAIDGAWYVCVNDARNPLQIGTITVTGVMNLILTDGTEMRPDKIVVKPGAALNVYGQSDGSGLLRANSYSECAAGIGAGELTAASFGTVNIYGGKVIASGGKYAAGIGGAGLNAGGGTVNIYGGDVTTVAGESGGSGIGNGNMQSGAVINYYGGRINAGSVSGTLNFIGYFCYEDDGTYVFADEYDASRTIVPGLPEAAEYIDENGDEQSTYDYKHLRENETTLSGVYYIFEDTTLTYRPTVSGTAALILKDGVTLTAPLGIGVNEGNTLKIYAHSTEEAVTGALVAGPAESMHAALGGDGYQATGTSGENYADSLGSGNILIAGGRITATGGTAAAAIGSGMGHFYRIKTGGSVTVTGGFVTAAGNSGPAIGAGSNVPTSVIHISGGVVNATGGSYGAGIGATAQNGISNTDAYSFEIVISGGSVTAKGGSFSITNIGTSYGGTTVTVSGGVIDASYTGHNGFSVGSASNTSVSITADDPDLSLKYSQIKAATVIVDEGLAYTDGTVVETPLANNKTIVNLHENFACVETWDVDIELPMWLSHMIDRYYVRKGSYMTPPDAPTAPKGYHFVGWYDYVGDRSYEFEYEPVMYDLILCSLYEKNVYTVTFDPDNGEEPFTQDVAYEDTATAPDEPQKAHATFDGWFLPNAVEPYDFSTPVAESFTLTAHWTYENVTVTFVPGNGSVVTTESVNYGGTVARPADPVKEGFVFAGWFPENSACVFDFDSSVTDDITLNAVWKYQSYTATDGTSGNWNEGYANLLDNNASTKWCISSFAASYIEFTTGDLIIADGYVLTTGADTDTNPSRNPTAWKILGKAAIGDNWTKLDEVFNDNTLGATSCTPYFFPIVIKPENGYRYFRVEFYDIGANNDGVFQLSEFAFTTASIAPIPTVTAYFDAGEGSGEVDPISEPADSMIEIPSHRGLIAPEGQVFDYWLLNDEEYYPGDSYFLDESVTFTAVYKNATLWELMAAEMLVMEDGDYLEYTLTRDVVAPEGALNLYVPEGAMVVIDLNGHKIDRAMTEPSNDGMVFYVDGVLCVNDYSRAKTGLITGGNRALEYCEGGGVFVSSTGSFYLDGGTISGNCANYGGGVECYGLFINNGGVITGNYARYFGGGIEVYGNGELAVGGSAQIYGNYVDDDLDGEDLIENNVGLYEGSYITTADPFTSDAHIGISYDDNIDEDNPYVFTYGLNGGSASVFFSDDENYAIGVDEYGEAMLMIPSSGIVGDLNGDNSVDVTDVTKLLNIIAGNATVEYGNPDLNNDGSVDVTDVTRLLNILAGN